MGNCTSPLRRAINDRDAKTVKALLKEAGKSAQDYINNDFTADLLFCCCFINKKSPLHTALRMQSWDIVWILLEYGANPECQNGPLKQTPLHIACRENNLKLVKHLIEAYQVNVYLIDSAGQYPLHTSCMSESAIIPQDISVLKYFKEVGHLSPNDLRLTDGNGNTPLTTAIDNGHKKAVEFLQSLGAKTHYGKLIGGKELADQSSGVLPHSTKAPFTSYFVFLQIIESYNTTENYDIKIRFGNISCFSVMLW